MTNLKRLEAQIKQLRRHIIKRHEQALRARDRWLSRINKLHASVRALRKVRS